MGRRGSGQATAYAPAVREQLGDLLLELGQADAALAAYQASLKATPNRLRGYYGAARAAERAGLSGIAREYQDQLRALTSKATGTRPEIEYGRHSLAAR